MTSGPYDEVVADASGRFASGRSFRTLADEHADFVAGLRGQWDEEAPLPYEEFAVPYLQLRRNLLDECERLGGNLRYVGDGQVFMAERNTDAEDASTIGSAVAGPVQMGPR
ncbi:hypothetical protein GCM10022224_047370 [Nonomuraea antimicrobica]|uniref:Uncharacterized protein n=1 Tax=Nonomuraea antimicrobica TaxID=561173 RepID=A0ABP7C5D7_9ACTN